MTIRLKPDPEKRITEAIQTGAHRDSEEVIDRASPGFTTKTIGSVKRRKKPLKESSERSLTTSAESSIPPGGPKPRWRAAKPNGYATGNSRVDNLPYDLSTDANLDLFEMRQRIPSDSIDLADRIESEFSALFESLLGRMPGQGHSRRDLTGRPVQFFPLYSFLVIGQMSYRS